MTIYKFPLAITGTQHIELAKGAKVLSVQMQGKNLCLWALLNPRATTETRRFEVVGTGHPLLSRRRKFLASVQDGGFVWHVFELIA